MKREQAIAVALSCEPAEVRFTPVGGGCINQAARVEYPHGVAFAKWNDRPLPGQFRAEKAGLQALAAAASGLVIPRVLAVRDEDCQSAFLLLEYLPPGTRAADFETRLGNGLANLHRHSDARGFGFDCDGYCGASVQPNSWRTDWATFYAELRLSHQLQLCQDRGLDRGIVRQLEVLIRTLPDRLADPEPSALIHGDLWSGNLHSTADGQPALLDPAAYFGHREAELGMMVLFGGFGERVFAAYDEAYPLQPGWRERLPIYTLYHVLNHYALFGGGYAAQILRQLT